MLETWNPLLGFMWYVERLSSNRHLQAPMAYKVPGCRLCTCPRVPPWGNGLSLGLPGWIVWLWPDLGKIRPGKLTWINGYIDGDMVVVYCTGSVGAWGMIDHPRRDLHLHVDQCQCVETKKSGALGSTATGEVLPQGKSNELWTKNIIHAGDNNWSPDFHIPRCLFLFETDDPTTIKETQHLNAFWKGGESSSLIEGLKSTHNTK